MSTKKHPAILSVPIDGSDNYYQISDDDVQESEENLLDETGGAPNGRGPYERAWSTEATRALIHVRGPLEGSFTEGRQKRTALWISVTRQLHKLGYRYSAAKVQKKWHNILITYNKNLHKKYLCDYVHWEFFEEMFKYLQGKKAECDQYGQDDSNHFNAAEQAMLQPQIHMETKSVDDFEEEESSCGGPEEKKSKYEYNGANPVELPLEISYASDVADVDNKINTNFMPSSENVDESSSCTAAAVASSSNWWKEYFERKLTMEREKIELQKEMHRDLMHFNKMSLIQQEKIERIKIDAINSLTSTLQRFVEVKKKN